MFKLVGNHYVNLSMVTHFHTTIHKLANGSYILPSLQFCLEDLYVDLGSFKTFEEAVVVFTQLLEAIGVPQDQIEKHIEESRQKVAEQEGESND